MSGFFSLPVADLLVPLLVKSSLVVALAGLVALAVERAAAATRHRVWAAAFAALALLPFLAVGLPGFELAWLPAVEVNETPASLDSEAGLRAAGVLEAGEHRSSKLRDAELALADLQGVDPQRADLAGGEAQAAAPPVLPSWPPAVAKLFIAAYLAGVGLLLAWLFLGIALVRRWAARGEVVTDAASWAAVLEPLAPRVGKGVELVVTPRVRVPMVWMPLFARRATVLLPEAARSWTPAQRRDTLVHELAHVQRRDGPVQLAARLVCIAYWFHPLVWLALARLRLEAERACDDRVLATGSASCDYAERLVALARGAARLRPGVAATQATVSLSGRQQLARRVHALLDAGRRRVPAGPLATALLAAAVLLPALALAPVHLVEAAGPGAGGPFAAVDGVLEADAAPEESATGSVAGTASESAAWSGARDSMPDALSPRGLPPVMAAVAEGDADTLSRLLAEGADADAAVRGRGTPLILAAAAGDAALVERLLAAGADPNRWETGRNRPDDLQRSPLGAAARSGDLATVERLLAAGAEVDGLPRGDATPLMTAARHGHPEVAERLVEAGADIGIAVKGNGTPLIEAVRSGDRRVVDLLLDRGADPAVGVEGDGNPLIWAVIQGDRGLVQRLLDLGADPNAWVEGDESAFHHAVESRDGEMVRLLLDAGADPDVDPDLGGDVDFDVDGDTDHDFHVDADADWGGDGSPLIVAAGHGDLETVERLLAAGADPDRAVPGDGSPLISAAAAGHLAVVERLLAAGARPDLAVEGDGSPLIAAAAAGQLQVVDRLLAAGADVDLVVPGDETALIQAAGHGHLATVRHLVERGADVHLGVEVNLWRGGAEVRTPLSQARRGGHDDVVRYLLSQGARK